MPRHLSTNIFNVYFAEFLPPFVAIYRHNDISIPECWEIQERKKCWTTIQSFKAEREVGFTLVGNNEGKIFISRT